MPLQIGQTIHHDRYRIDSLLGQGGMGAVYLAWDTNLEIPVAIKENLDASPEAQKQFTREAQILARLAHPNLPRVIDSFILPEVGQYLVMDYVEGEDLQSMLERLGRLPEPQVLIWISQICDALAYLHNQSSPIIHRDIKPGNIKIRPDGRAMLVDFGIAKVYDQSLATTLGARAFTPGYSPPEQYGTGGTDRRSDIYALGATIYHLLTGKTPPDSIKRMTNRADMSPPRQLNNEISPNLERIILRSTELDTDRRYQSVEELLAELRRPEAEIGSSTKTEAVPHSSVATRPVEKPEPALGFGKTPLQPKETNAAQEDLSSPAQDIVLPRRRTPVWPFVVGGITLLILTGLCVTIVFSKLLGSIFPAQIGAPIRTTLAALPSTPGTPEGIEPLTSSVTPGNQTLITPSVTHTQAISPTPTETPTPFEIPPAGYLPVAQVLPVEAAQKVRGVAVKDNFVYLLTTGGTLDVFDLTGLSVTTDLQTYQKPISSLQLQNGNGLLLNDPYLYVYGSAGLDVVDVSDPSIPGYVKSLTDQSIFNLALFEGFLLAPGQRYLAVYSLSQPEFPRLVSQYDAGQDYMLFAAIGYQKYLYASEFSNAGAGSLRYLVLDFSDPTSLQELGAYDHRYTAYHYYLFEDELVACADSMLETWELRNPEQPSMLYSEPAQARVCALDNAVIVTNGSAAQLVPGGFKTFSSFAPGGGQPDGFPYGSAVMGDYIFLAQSERILVLYRNLR
jgi:eukaryotic-like serine/threonine-protein kinase